MPIYKANGKTFNIPQEKVDAFEKHYPDATVEVYDGASGKGYNIPVAKAQAFKKKYPKWSYDAPAKTPVAEDEDLLGEVPDHSAPSTPEPTAGEKQQEPWTPTPIQKAFALDQARNAVEGSRQRMQKAVDDSRRLARSMTQEGRDELKRGETAARMAGVHRQPLGLSPTVGQGSDTDGAAPFRNPVSPKVAGVKVVDGKPTAEYMLPDGSLTTDFTEADRAEYNARSARLQHEFEKRMAANGLDPSRQEDIDEQRKRDLMDETEKRLERQRAGLEAQTKERAAKDFAERKKWDSKLPFWDNVANMFGQYQQDMAGRSDMFDRSGVNPEFREGIDHIAAREHLEQAKRTLEAGRLRKSEGFMGGFWKIGNNLRNIGQGMADTLKETDFWAQGFLSVGEGMRLLDIEEKLKSGEALTDSETQLMMAKFTDQTIAENSSLPHGYTAGKITAEMFPFMAQMIMNPASGLSKSLVKKYGTSQIKKIGLTIAGDVAESAILANTLQAPKTAGDVISRHIGQASSEAPGSYGFEGGQGWGEAMAKAEGAATIENYTEMLGEHFGVIGNALGKAVSKTGRKVGMGKVVDAVSDMTSRIGATEWAKAIGNLESRAHWNGVPGEILEEEAGIVLNSALVGDNRISDLWDADQQIDIALGVGLFGGFVSGIKTVGYPIGRFRAKGGLRKADGIGGWRLADEWDGIRTEIEQAEEPDLTATVQRLVSDHAKSREQAKAITDYARALMKARGYNIAVAKAAAEGAVAPERLDAEDSFAAGEEIAGSGDTQAMRDVRLNLERQRERLAKSFGDEWISENLDGDDPVGFVADMEADGEARQMALDYVNARHVYEGMLQGVRDDIDSRIAVSDAEIDGRTNRATGMLQPATMKMDDRAVYVVSGDVVMTDDGTAVDEENSSESVIVRDAATGKLEFVDPSQILALGEAADAAAEKQAAADRIRQESAQEAADAIDGRRSFLGGESYTVLTDMDGGEMTVDILGPALDGEGNPLDGMVEVQLADGTVQSFAVADLQEMMDQSDRMRAELALQERQMDAAIDLDSVTPDYSDIDIYVDPGIGASDERSPLSPLGWIPKDENGAPLFEQAPDAETGWDALVEDSEGDEAEAMEWAKAQVKLLEKEAAKARKALANVPATTDRGKWKADRRAAREALEAVEARLKAWQDMLAVPQARADEAARQAALAEAEAEAEAIHRAQEEEAARKAEEARLEAERAEQARLERERRDAEARAEAERLRREKEARDGIPDMLEDTPAAARERGARRSGTTVYRRQDPVADKVEGKEVVVDFNEKKKGHTPKGRIVVMEAAQGQPSHMEGRRNPMFFIDEAQPKDRTDPESILDEQKKAREMDPEKITDTRNNVDAFRGAPTVNSRGETIQGNHRMAILRYMYAHEPQSQKRYRDYLIEHAEDFGFSPEQIRQIEAMKAPVLVNMVDVDDSMAIELGQDTKDSGETGGKDRIDPVRLSASIGDKMGRFMDTLLTEDSETEEGASLRTLIRRNGLAAIKYLRDMGKIDDRQYNTAVIKENGSLSDEGVEDIEKFIKQAFFAGESREFADMFDALPAKAQGAVLAQMWRDAKTEEADKAAPHVKEAVRAFSAMMSMPQFAQARNFKDALAGAEMWRRQMEFGDDGDMVDNSNRFSNFAIRLAAMMKGSTMKETRAVLKQMLDWMQAEQEAEPSMFDMMDEGSEAEEDRSFAGAVRRVLDMEYQPGESSPVIPGRSEKSERSERSEKSGGTRKESHSALEDKTESKTDKTDRDNGNGENGGPDVAGGVQESPQGGKRGSRGNDKGGKRTEGSERPADSGAGAGAVESSEADGGKKREKPRDLTEADLDAIDPTASGIDESVIDAARDYLRGERSQWNEMCHKIIQDYVRNTGNSIESSGDAARPAAQELPGADAEAEGPGEGRDGGAPDGMDRGDGGSDRPGGREGGEDGARGGRALPGEEGTGGTEEEGSVSDDGGSRPGRRGGGRRAGGTGSDVRKPGGKEGSQGDARNDGSRTSEAGAINGGSAEADTSKREDVGAEAPTQTQIKADDGEASADAMISDALADIRDILSNPAMTRRGQLNDVTTLIAGLGVNAVRFMGATAKLGCGLVLKGFYKFAKWRGEMHRNLDPLLMEHTDLTDEQADEFIRMAWDMKMTYRGERRKISEWASILEQEELRRLAQMGIAEKRKLQAEAEDKEVVVGDIDNIRETLPFLLPAQHEDVEKAERQFFKPEHADREHGYGKGYLFTNGTGTGKTYTGLGIVKRFLKQGKGRVLIVTVNDTKISDWIKDARNLGIEATQLADTKSKGKGVVVTQYANLRQNYALLEDQFDLIVYDESHKLMENQEGEAGSTAEMHHMVAARDARSVIQREVEVSDLGKRHREAVMELQRAQEINNLIQKPVSLLSKKEKDMLDASGVRTPEEAENLLKKADEHVAELANEMERVIDSALADPAQRDRAEDISKATKTVFLSATPFNTPASLDYSEGYIFSYEEGKEGDDRRRMRNAFLRKNFGKSHRPNKNGDMTRMSEGQITDPQGVEEEEIRFSNYLQETLHTMSGRMLDSAFDYSRSFPRFEFEQAAMLNEALAEIAHGPLASAFKSTLLDYNYSTAFWEIIKTGMALDRIKEHLALGRKVVVFHRRKASNQGVNRPFMSGLQAAMMGQDEGAKRAAAAFAAKYAPLLAWETTLDYTYPQDRILNEFVTPEERKDYEERMAEWEKRRDAAERAGKRVPPEPKLTSKKVGIFNGDQTAREKQSAVDDFILDGSEKDVIVVQVQSGKEGISLHDTTGKHQRVMMSLALPQSPIEFIQAEGRIYRVGNQSNAIFEYPLLGIDRELFDFAMKINGRSQTSENLAMGDKSRGLRDSITRGALGSTQIPVAPDQGVGGKMLDSRQTQTQTDFDQAMTNWKEWRDKDAELTDYDEMQIPDPLGFKLMEWAGLERGETVLVGYAGEGSAARYAPTSAKLIAIESESGKLARLAALLGGGGRKILDASFMEDDPSSDHIYSTVNKADIVIVKAKSGSYKEGFTSRLRAARDVFKALQHTEDSGRVLAIVPSANLKGVDGVLNYVKQLQPREGCTVRSIVNLPASLFGNAVSVVVIDKNADKSIADAKAAKKPQIIDVEDASTVEETLASLRDVEVEKREVDRIAKAVKRVKRTLNPFMESTLVSTTRMRGNGSQKDVHVSRYGVNVHFKKHVVPNRANYASFWNGLSIDFDKLADRSYLEEIANYWAGARKYADMSIEEYAEERGHRFRNDGQLQEAHSLLENICTLIEAATGKTATQLANIAEGRVENEIKRDMTVGEFKDIYKTLDSGSEELDALAERVFAVAAQIPGLTIKLSDGKNFSSHNVMAHYAPGKNAIELNADNFNSVRHTDMQKAQCILHETIHAVTCWAVAQYKDATDEERRAMGPLADACRDILDVFKAINNDAFRAQLQAGSKLRDNAFYGLTDEYEMLAEMANPAFRQALKAKRLWRQLVNGIKKLFGIDVTDSGEGATTAFDALNRAINTILDSFDAGAYAGYQADPHFSERAHEMRSLFDETEQPGPSAARQQSLFGTPAERDERKAEDQAEPGAETASRRGKERKRWVQTSLFGEEKQSDGNGDSTDAMGNPIDGDGRLIIENIKGLDELSDADFARPTRNVGLPPLPANVDKALGANGRKVIIKKRIFIKNRDTHGELSAADSREILSRALYNPDLVGANQPIRRPDYRVAIQTGDRNAVVVLDVYAGKENVEIVGWRKVDAKGLEKMKRQAEREGGQFLILSPREGSAAALSALPSGVSSRSEAHPPLPDKQLEAPESSAEAMDRANGAIDEYAERFADLYAKYSAFIEGRERLADDLWERLQDELALIEAILEEELGCFYLSEGNSEEDAARMARDKAGLVRAEVTMQLARPEIMMRSYGEESRVKGEESRVKGESTKPRRSRYRSAADEVLEWQSAEGHLPALKEGEFALVERQFVKDGAFPFLTGAGKIRTDADVAYLFRCLENSAIEQTFAVLVKKGKPLVVHIGMGSQTASVVDKSAILGALQAYGADKVYFVHNHPSGNLRQSPQDDSIARRIREIVGEERMGESIIIDTTSGKYAVFGGYTSSSEIREMPGEAKGAEREHGVLSFSRQVFAKDYDPEALTKIRDSKGVAEFVSTRRLGEGPKVGYLLLSRQNSVIGAMQSSHPDYSDPQGLAREAMGQAAMRGAVGVILYGNAALEREPLRRIRETLEQESGGEMRLLDAMRVTSGLGQGYVSAADSSLMEPEEEYGAVRSDETDESAIRFRLREKPDPKKTRKVYKLMRLEGGRLYPLFIDGAAPTELGVWYDADSPNLDMLRSLPSGTYLVDQTSGRAQSREEWEADHPELASVRSSGERSKFPSKAAIDFATSQGLRWIQIEDTQRAQRRFGGESRRYWNLGINGSGSVSTFSMRPGWHAGSLPTMRQIGKGKGKDLRDDRFVWVEGEVSADHDYNAEAARNPDKDIPDRIPEDGFYMKATNADKAKSQADRVGWYVAGAFRANRIISDAEAREIIDRHNAGHPDAPVEYDYPRESGVDFVPTAAMNQGAIYREEDRADSGGKETAAKSAVSKRETMRERIRSIAEPCGVEVEVLEDASGLDGRKRDAKGWFDPQTGRIVIVLSNNATVQDAEATLLHEMVAHKGLRALFGTRFEAFLDAVWEHADDAVKERISLLASRRGWDRRTAAEEYMAQLAEDGSFKEAGAGWWQKLKALFMDFLRSCGFSANVRISDAELRYVLWMSWKNLQNPGAYLSFLGEAERIAKAGELGLPALRTAHNAQRGDPLFRDGDFTVRDRRLAASIYEGMLREGSWQFREATQDSMLGLRSLYEAVLTQGDKRKRKDFRIEDVAGYENAYLYENRMSSANCAEQHEYFREHMAPLLKSIHALCGRDDDARRDMTDYMMAKHGLERNAYMRAEAVAAGEPGDRDFAGLCGLTGESDWRNAEAEAQTVVDDYEAAHDPALIDQLWADTKKATQATLQKIWLSGLISDETYQKTLGMYDHYIPLRGWDETTSDEVYGYLTSPDGPLLGSVWKHAEGRESKADDPIATIAKMADDAIRQGNRNVMKQRMLNFVHGNPSDLVSVSRLWLQYDDAKDEWHPVFADLEPDMTPAEIANEIKRFEEKMEGLAASDPDHYKSGRDARRVPYKVVRGNMDEHQVLVKRNGHTYVMTINGNPRAAQALNGLTNPDTDMGGVYGKMLKGASYINRQLSAFYTTRNPDFVMSNFLRDAFYSNCMTWVKESPRYALRFHRNFGRVNPFVTGRLLKKWEKGKLGTTPLERAFAEFMQNGGETGYTNVRDIERHKREIAAELRRMDSSRPGPRHVGAKAWRWLMEKLDLFNRSVENTARFAAFLTSREMGRSLDRAIYDAKEISVNFNKKGAGDRFLDARGQTRLGKTGSYIGGAGRAAYVFWNAGVQGMTNFGRAGKRNPGKAMGAAASLFTLGAVIPLLAQLLSGDGGDGDDKDAYYNLPEYIRRSNICFKAGDRWVTIPLPIEYRAIYGLGELATGVISGKERYSDAELAYFTAAQVSQILPLDFLEGANPTSHDGLSASSLAHPFIPSFAKPFMEAYVMNRGWTGMPVSKDTPFNKLDPEFKRVYQSTDQHLAEFSRWLNNTTGGNDYRKGAIDINPAKLEYLLNGTLGGAFSFPMKVKKTGETIFGDREFEWRNMPLANRVVKTGDERTANRKLQSEYYKYRAEAEKTEHEFKGFQKEAANGIMESARRADFMYNSEEFVRWQIADAFEPTMAALRKAVQEAPDAEKAQWQKEYYARMRELVDALHDPDAFLKQTGTDE